MKVILNVILLGLALLITDISHSSEADVVRLTQADSGKKITVKTGDLILIELTEQGATGYEWQFDDLDGQFFELKDIATEKVHGEKDFTGAPVLKKWRLQAKKPGQAAIQLNYFRPWEDKSTAVQTFGLQVTIN